MKTSAANPLDPAYRDPLKAQLNSTEQPVKRIGVFFATREGHTKRIAEQVAADLRKLGFNVDLHDVRQPIRFSSGNYCAAVLAASVHGGIHETEMVRFVKQHRSELERVPTAFLSVSLSEAGAERRATTPVEHTRFATDVNQMLCKFINETKWAPTHVMPVAGALLYTHYNFLLRLIMRSIAKRAGASTDASQDYVYTDWAELDKLVNDFAADIRVAPVTAPSSRGRTQTASPARAGIHA
jgi:menaquinone-dependent protoporphyrinogen oxidase